MIQAESLQRKEKSYYFAAAGVPELRSRAAVQTDGNISLPLVGVLQVAGLSLPQIRTKVGAVLPNKVFRQRSPEGRESVIVIDADEITATVSEYRPIYINGDVSKPGQYPYLPSITARQLIALASGYDIMHVRMNNPYLDLADLRAEYGWLWTEFAKEQARLWRIKTELGEATQIAPNAAKEAPIARSAISEIFNAETEYLKAKQSDYQQEKEFIQRGVRQGYDEVRVLSEQQKREDEGFQSEQEELQKAQDMFARFVVVGGIMIADNMGIAITPLVTHLASQFGNRNRASRHAGQSLCRLIHQSRSATAGWPLR